jgi:hypothetical protein
MHLDHFRVTDYRVVDRGKPIQVVEVSFMAIRIGGLHLVSNAGFYRLQQSMRRGYGFLE